MTVITRAVFLEGHPGQAETLGTAEFVVLDGNRRLAAARLAGVDELRVDLNDGLAGSAADLLESALIANLHRKDLAPLEEARTIADLLQVHGSQRQVARRIGKSHTWIAQRLALLELTEDLQQELASGLLPVEDARQIGRLPAEQQPEAATAAKHTRESRAKDGPERGGRKRSDHGGAAHRGASSPPQSGNAVATAVAELIDQGDTETLAATLRGRWPSEKLRRLVELLTA